jgi:hypothetical protein
MANSLTPIKLVQDDFENVMQDVREKHGISGTLAWVLKREHGWTWRQAYYGNPIEIDFWNDSAKSMFLLTYSHLIAKSLKMYNKNTG